jgi:ribosomal protein L40E
MSITVTCPNGHELKIKSKYAGRAGICPHCKARIKIPVPDQEIPGGLVRGIIDPEKSGLSGIEPDVWEFVETHEEPAEETTKVCQKCYKEIPDTARVCPHCNTYVERL